MNIDTLVLLLLLLLLQNVSYKCWMIIRMKNVNSFQIAKVHPYGLAQHLLDFFPNFSVAMLRKVLLIKKRVRTQRIAFFSKILPFASLLVVMFHINPFIYHQQQPPEVFCKKRCKIVGLRSANLFKKRDSDTGVFLQIFRNF